VFEADRDDPAMRRAYESARESFRYFWREVAWERRRIVPALDVASVKAPFHDGTHQAEHMWLSDVDFDGRLVSGVLLNTPNWVMSVKEGDLVRIPLGQISDWMYAISGRVYGAYTVNLLRSRMKPKDRQEHDEAWGLDFCDPAQIRVTPNWPGDPQEHPMSEAMAPSLKEQLAKDPSFATAKGDRGWTILHQEALAGSAPTVTVLLKAGADPDALTDEGMTPSQLAASLGWDRVVALLERK